MESLRKMWEDISVIAKISLVTGVIVIFAAVASLGYWAYRPDYQVLFTDMSSKDAAMMVAELDKMKTPYSLSDAGNTILVPKDIVYKTRLKLMGKDLPLHGAVGFEVFNNADFGMTEFVQKVNYQRAIQGELTRTILSIEDIQDARVHLAIPEQGLFKKTMIKPKASVTLAMKFGRTLNPDQIIGIQRLVAASVPDIMAADVTILDQHGIALTSNIQGESASEVLNTQLENKKKTEEYISKKVTQVLERTFGSGQAIASVDVQLNLEQSKVTTEEILPAKSNAGAQDGAPTGVVVRERQTVRDGVAANPGSLKNSTAGSSGSSTTEADYQVGRRVEQSANSGGGIKRMTIAVLIRKNLNDIQTEKLKEIVTAAAGFNTQRGDAVVIYSMDKFNVSATATSDTAVAPSMDNPPANFSGSMARARNESAKNEGHMNANASSIKANDGGNRLGWLWYAFGVLVALVFLGYLLRRPARNQHRKLSPEERAHLQAQIEQWLGVDAAVHNPSATDGRRL